MYPSSRNMQSGTDESRIGRQVDPSKLSKDDKLLKIAPERRLAIRVLIADRDSMTGDLLALALASDSRYEASAVPATRLVHAVSTSEVSLAIIGANVTTATGNGHRLAETLSRRHPETKIIMLLDDNTSDSVLSAFRSGASGIFCRRQPMSEFLDCVNHVRRGFIWAGREESTFLLEALKTVPKSHSLSESDLPQLTARELEVVRYAAKGKTNRTIASEMGLSEHTVKNYLFRAFAKIGVSSRVELLFNLSSRSYPFDAAIDDNFSASKSLE